MALQKGIELITTATEEEKNENYEVSLQLYKDGLEKLLHAMKYETHSEKMKAAIKSKCKEYLDRAEKLKERIESKQKPLAPESSRSKSVHSNSLSDAEQTLEDRISTAIVSESPNVHWQDVIGVDKVKEELREFILLPMKFPHLFVGRRIPCKTILLYGPAGTGKTFLAKAIATEAENTYNVLSMSAADLTWRGDGERTVRGLFTLARKKNPSVIFIDEIDSLCSPDSPESARRIKTEFIIQMGDIGGQELVIVLAATSVPWMVDPSIRRRFEKRIHVPMPGETSRTDMFKLYLNNDDHHHELTEENFVELGRRTAGYSGGEISSVVGNVLMRIQEQNATLTADPELIPRPKVTMADMIEQLSYNKPSVNENELKLFDKFIEDFG